MSCRNRARRLPLGQNVGDHYHALGVLDHHAAAQGVVPEELGRAQNVVRDKTLLGKLKTRRLSLQYNTQRSNDSVCAPRLKTRRLETLDRGRPVVFARDA